MPPPPPPPPPPSSRYDPPNVNVPFEPGVRDPFAPHAGVRGSRPARAGNRLGRNSLVVSIIGLTCCGPLALLSLVMSVLAMRSEPRGLAIAALVISIVAIIFYTLVALVTTLALATMGHGSANAGLEVIVDYAVIDVEIQELGSFPATLDELNLPASRTTDPWGFPYHYEVYADGGDYKLISVGPDGTFNTSDDIQLNPP